MKITAFVEKPQKGAEPGNLANAGIYVLEKKVLLLVLRAALRIKKELSPC